VIDVEELTSMLVALVDPNSTDVIPTKPVPVMVSDVPPAAGPLLAAIFLIVGAGPGAT
jgi:hypothetical protein